jgi:hypothetical protein
MDTLPVTFRTRDNFRTEVVAFDVTKCHLLATRS